MSSGSDSEDDRELKSRPLSTLALTFASSLDTAFELKPEIETLSKSVARKRQSVSIQQTELQKLQAKIRETEERLNRQHHNRADTNLAPQRRVNASARAFKTPALATISSSEEDSESSETTSEVDGTTKEDSSPNEEVDTEAKPEPAEKPSAARRRPKPLPSQQLSPSKANMSRSPAKAPATSQANRKRVASRSKA